MTRLTEEDSAARKARTIEGVPNASDFSEALARGLMVLNAFGGERRHLTQADLARELGLSRATVRRAVLTLEHLGYLDANGRAYDLTPKVLELAGAYLTSNIVSAVVQPLCDRVSAELHEACSVAVLDGTDALIIARAVPNRLIAVGNNIGYRTPALISSLGKVLIAHLDPDERKSHIDHSDSGTGAAETAEWESIKSNGFSYVANDIELGAHSIAVPIKRRDGQVVAALHVGCSIERIAPNVMLGDVLMMLRKEAESLQRMLV